ncbi:hypothetical protein [Deinococcus pimensis]|uniref:hypothetical protein n=1 Tax=Deinococcus pimensis TaxID=309888 RepID=UPI000482BCB3|nr:hypothetical protein [Deinococcus pimensis]
MNKLLSILAVLVFGLVSFAFVQSGDFTVGTYTLPEQYQVLFTTVPGARSCRLRDGTVVPTVSAHVEH